MANTKSAKKATRVAARRTEVNKNRVSRIRTQVAQPELMRGAQKGVMHKNTASRKVSRLSARVKALKA
jgi:small subunit ribosomal protein S20